MKRNVIVASLGAIILFAGCEKIFMKPDVQSAAVNTFDFLWKKIDEQYSMFDVKEVDWQAVYDTFRPQVHNDMRSDSLFAVCAAMLNTLYDGHVNLVASFDASHSDSVHYRFYADDGIDIDVVALYYLGRNYHSTGGMVHNSLCNGRIIYIYYGSFSNTVTASGLKHIIDSYPEAEGMIIDVRGNGGGTLSNIASILSVMPSHGQTIYYSQIKSGPLHDQFTPLQPTYAPQVSGEVFTRPVVVLTDRGCFSATSTFAVATQAYNNIWLMGDTTGGGMGLPTMGSLPNGWIYRFSITRTIALDGSNYENGVPPDIPLKFNRENAFAYHRDNIIDSACSLILSGNLINKTI